MDGAGENERGMFVEDSFLLLRRGTTLTLETRNVGCISLDLLDVAVEDTVQLVRSIMHVQNTAPYLLFGTILF
jgi:hypothetical protein